MTASNSDSGSDSDADASNDRQGQGREMLSVRVAESRIDRLNQVAEEYDVPRSTLIRRALAAVCQYPGIAENDDGAITAAEADGAVAAPPGTNPEDGGDDAVPEDVAREADIAALEDVIEETGEDVREIRELLVTVLNAAGGGGGVDAGGTGGSGASGSGGGSDGPIGEREDRSDDAYGGGDDGDGDLDDIF